MFQASLNDIIIAEANTSTELSAQVAHEIKEGRLYDPQTGEPVTFDDCDVVEIVAFAKQVAKARDTLGLGAPSDMLHHCGDGGLPLSTLEKFVTDGYTDDDDLTDLAEAFDAAGAADAARICRQHIGL